MAPNLSSEEIPMKKKLHITVALMALLFKAEPAKAWGATGHRAVAEIAYQNITPETRRRLDALLQYESLANGSTYGDDIKSDDKYKKYYSWHFVNFAAGEAYEKSVKNPEGDVYSGILTCIDKIQTTRDRQEKIFYVKMLTHLVGDLHQPLHVGQAEDQGGNKIKVTWFGKKTNLHHVWDSDMLDSYGMSYSELSRELMIWPTVEKQALQQGSLNDWMTESQKTAAQVYASAPDGTALSYPYQYEWLPMAKMQLRKGGLRLAKMLNDLSQYLKV